MDAEVLAHLINESGTISAYFQGRSKGKRAVTPAIQITGLTERYASLLATFVGRPAKAGRWICRHPNTLRALLPQLIPFLNEKRKLQAEWLMDIVRAMPFYGGTPPWAIARAESIRELNV